jgi:hypothetical protein
MGFLILQSCSFAPPGLCYPKLPPLRPAESPQDQPLRPGIHRHLWSPPGHAPPHPRPAQPCRSSILMGHSPQPCMISALLARLPRPAQPFRSSISLGCTPQPYMISAFLARLPRTAQPCRSSVLLGGHFSNVCFWHLCWESDGCKCVDLFLHPLFYFICLWVFLVPIPCCFDSVVLEYILKSSIGIPPQFLCLLRFTLSLLCLLWFHTHLSITLSSFIKIDIYMLMGITLNL